MGEGLLSDTEKNKFNNFLDQFGVGPYNEHLAFDETALDGFLGDPLQSFFPDAGTSLHFPNDQSTASAQDGQAGLFTNPFPFAQNKQHTFSNETTISPDMIAAASSLMRNSHNEHYHVHNNSNSSYDSVLQDGMNNLTHRESGAFSQTSFASESVSMFANGPIDLYTHAMASGMRHESRPTSQAALNGSMSAPNPLYTSGRLDERGFAMSGSTSDLQWGSDGHFGNNEYVPPLNQQSVAHVAHTLDQRVSAFGEPTSATTTHPSSPVTQKSKRKSTIFTADNLEPVANDNGAGAADPTRVSKAPKRRKTKSEIKPEEPTANDDDHDFYDEPKPPRGKPAKRGTGSKARQPRANAGPRKRNAGGSTERKPKQRDNLTEEERRFNHVQSENTRRLLVRQRIDDLCELVPGLAAGGFGRAVQLSMTAEWLEKLVAGNERLRETLAQLGGE